MKSKIQFSLLTAFTICGALTTAAVFVGNAVSANPPKVGEAAEVTHTLLMNKDNTIKDNWVNVDNSRQIWVSWDGYTAGTTNFGSIASGGSLRQAGDHPLYGMKSVTVSLTSGSLEAAFGYSGDSRETVINAAQFPAGSATTFSLEGDPCCFTFRAKADTVIDYISITYSCSYIASPTQASSNVFDLGTDAESMGRAGDLSFGPSTAHTNGSTRSFHIWSSTTTHAETWPSIMIALKTPVAVTTSGSFEINGYFECGDHAWMSVKLYDTSWNQVPDSTSASEFGGGYTTGQYATNWAKPNKACTIGFIRLTFVEYAGNVKTSMYLDNCFYVPNV